MKIKSLIVFIIGLIIFSAAICIYMLFFYSHDAGFTKKDFLSSGNLTLFAIGLQHSSSSPPSYSLFSCKLSSESSFNNCFAELYEPKLGQMYSPPMFAKSPQGSRFYVGVNDNCLYYFINGKNLLFKQILFEEFNLPDGYNTSTRGIRCLGKDRLAIPINNRKTKSSLLLDWDVNIPPPQAKRLELRHSFDDSYYNVVEMIKDKSNDKHYSFSQPKESKYKFLDSAIIDIPEFNYKDMEPAGRYETVDYSKDFGWLFSPNDRSDNLRGFPYPNIVYSQGNALALEVSVKGINAFWGADGYIYCLNRSCSLMRISPKNKIKEKIFSKPIFASKEFQYSNIRKPIMSSDRRFIIYWYEMRGKTTIAVFDLLKKEYCIRQADYDTIMDDFVLVEQDTSITKENAPVPKDANTEAVSRQHPPEGVQPVQETQSADEVK